MRNATVTALISLGLLSAGLLSATCSRPAKQPVEAIYLNGDIYTVNPALPRAQAMAVQDGRIVFVGSNEEALATFDSETSVDLGGRFVMPGMIDTHAHPGLVALIGEVDEGPSVLPQTTKEALFEKLAELARIERDQPIFAAGEWDVAMFLPEGPNKEDLDVIFPDKPALLFDNSGHSTWLNSAALAMFGVDRDTPDLSPDVSVFVRDRDGNATGWVKEFALMQEMSELLARPNEELKERILFYLSYLSSKGVTTVWDAGNFALDDEIYGALAELDRANRLPVRYEGSFHIYGPRQIDGAVDELLRLRQAYSGERLELTSVKVHYDGVVEIGTAAMLNPYVLDPESRGGFLFGAARLADFLLDLERHDIDLHLHAVGDAATREILDAVELAQRRHGNPLTINVTISHLEHVNEADFPRFAALGVHANFTPHWWGGTYFGRAGEMFVGADEIHRSQPAAQLWSHGANVTLSSDVTTLASHRRANPFVGIQMSITRQEFDGGPDAAIFGPTSSRLTIEQAVAGYTSNGAKQLGRGHEIGSIEVGKRADFVVLAESLLAVDTYQIGTVHPDAVVLDGRVVQGSL